jgi:hypothetical protein
VPGDTLNFVTDAIRRSDIEWVHVRHEEVTGFAAGAEAMLTGNLTACAGSDDRDARRGVHVRRRSGTGRSAARHPRLDRGPAL